MTAQFEQIIRFSMELEKLKGVMRRTRPLGLERFENSAEHSWQIALMALTLIPHAEEEVDALKVVTMLLIHDLVEIDTGDKFAYHDDHDDYENELEAAKRIFSLLPSDQGQKLLALWTEFEHSETPEARVAKAIDRLMPVLQNVHNGCRSWLDHDVSVAQVLKKNRAVAQLNPALWDYVQDLVIQAADKAGIRRD